MTNKAISHKAPRRLDHFYARADRWRDLASLALRCTSGSSDRESAEAALKEIEPLERYHAFPGERLMAALRDRVGADGFSAQSFSSLVRRISAAIVSRDYKKDATEWETVDDGDSPADLLPPTLGTGGTRRPYFELLVVTPLPTERWPRLVAEMRRLRRPEDSFVYEVVPLGSFEDAIGAAILNPDVAAVIMYEGFPFSSRADAPVLREILAAHDIRESAETGETALSLANALKRLRPELDLYLLSDRHVETLAGDPRADSLRRIFYQVEEPLEMHLAVLEGVADRFESPFFDNLKKYAQRPIGTFHALPIARGKSVFRSDWIRDMGEFYGINLFLAESSATTGGLDSLLEPTGTIKRAQDLAARAFGADQVFFVTNGTSTSNKMVHQALVAPGDIVLLDRNCHKSHHYGLVLAGGQPLYVDAYPMTEYSMYGAVPLRSIKQALLDLRDEGRLDRLKMVDLTNCTFDGHIYNVRRVMEECLAIKPDLVFLWDEAWFGFAHWSPFLRPRTAMGAAADIERWMRDDSSLEAFERQQSELGSKPSRETLLDTRLIPDPRKIRLRVYQTNSTHKSMSAIRQGSMVLVKDIDFSGVEAQFHEAVFTHASTSPNQQIIASLDVARRQMELEGYGLVWNAIQVALDIRREVANHPLISKYFAILGADKMVPAEYRPSGFVDFLTPGTNWGDAVRSMNEDEFCLDPTRMTLICGTAGFDGTQFKALLADEHGIQVNKTSRNSVLLQSNINNTRSDVAHLIRVLLEISRSVDKRLAHGEGARQDFADRVHSLMVDVPDLPNFSHFANAYRGSAGQTTPEGDMRSAFYGAYDSAQCEYVQLYGGAIDARLKSGPDMVSANFVIPYPPGFPILVPGQVVTLETVDFMRALDVKEIHGYDAARGLKLIRLHAEVPAATSSGEEIAPRTVDEPSRIVAAEAVTGLAGSQDRLPGRYCGFPPTSDAGLPD